MRAKDLRIGIDFDNTIVCYDDIFHQAAREKGLIPPSTPKNKEGVRDYMRQNGNEDAWTELQGYVYGTRMSDVRAFPGALGCIEKLKANNIPAFIISHKTRHPYKGKAYDLHAAAQEWIKTNGLSLKDVFFTKTKQEKLEQIGKCHCTHFIDDLPEFLAEPDFPKSTMKLLFSPTRLGNLAWSTDVTVLRSWNEITRFLFSL